MYVQIEKQKNNKSRAVANSVTQKKKVKQWFGFEGNRPEAMIQRKQNANEINQNTCRDAVQLMAVTPLGSHAAQQGAPERQVTAANLIGNGNINLYTPGICYDAVAYVKYLLGAAITPDQIEGLTGLGWLPIFNFQQPENLWMGGAIPAGTAVGFERVGGPIFHAALAIGGTTVRGVNGGLLGNGWNAAGDRDLSTLLLSPQGQPNTYTNPNAPNGPLLRVWLSAL